MLCYTRFQQVVVADENYHHFPLIENSSYTDISKTDFSPYFLGHQGHILKLYWKIQRGTMWDIQNDLVTRGDQFTKDYIELKEVFLYQQ